MKRCLMPWQKIFFVIAKKIFGLQNLKRNLSLRNCPYLRIFLIAFAGPLVGAGAFEPDHVTFENMPNWLFDERQPFLAHVCH